MGAWLDKCNYMGNLDSLRDWGLARDYMEMQWRTLQHPAPLLALSSPDLDLTPLSVA